MLARRRTRTAGVTRGDAKRLAERKDGDEQVSGGGCWKVHRWWGFGPRVAWRRRGFAREDQRRSHTKPRRHERVMGKSNGNSLTRRFTEGAPRFTEDGGARRERLGGPL